MILNSELDKSLYLMLISDKNNRSKIIDFINLIPDDVFEKINLLIKEYMDYENNGISLLCRRDICLKEDITLSDFKYFINLDMCCPSLSITKFNCLKNESQELVVYFDNRINNIELLGQQVLGSFYSNENGEIIDVDYDLVDTLLGKMVMYSDKIMYKKFKMIFMRDIPDDIEINNKKLVRNKV